MSTKNLTILCVTQLASVVLILLGLLVWKGVLPWGVLVGYVAVGGAYLLRSPLTPLLVAAGERELETLIKDPAVAQATQTTTVVTKSAPPAPPPVPKP
jgi:hypothetical protein